MADIKIEITVKWNDGWMQVRESSNQSDIGDDQRDEKDQRVYGTLQHREGALVSPGLQHSCFSFYVAFRCTLIVFSELFISITYLFSSSI